MNEQTALSIRDLSVHFGASPILRQVTLEASASQLLGIVGPNGAGKSTLLRAACGLTPLSGGSVDLCGRPLERMSRREIARTVSFLPQSASVEFGFSVHDVVMMGRHPHLGRFQSEGEHDRAVVDWAMATADVEDLAERSVTELSGGERQRVLIARSLATEAPLLFLDEPTSNLDIQHALEIVELARNLTEAGKTVVMVVHDLNLARSVCARVALMDRGEIMSVGDPADVLSREHIERVFQVEAHVPEDRGPMIFALPEERRRDLARRREPPSTDSC